MSYTKINEIDKKQWNLLLSIMASPRCESSLILKINKFIDSTFYLFPKAKEYFIKRMTNIINKDDESTLMIIFRDIIDFQVHVSLIEPLIEKLKEMEIISKNIPDKRIKDITFDYFKTLVDIKDFKNLFKISPSTIPDNIYNPQELHLTIIARYYSVLSTIELKELIYDLKRLIKNKKFPIEINPIEMPHIVMKSNLSITTPKERKDSINNLIVERSDLSILNQIINQNGGFENRASTSPKIKIDGNIIDKYNNFILDTQSILNSEIERRAKIKAGLRIIGTTVLTLLGLFCSIGTIIPVIGAVAVVTCPTLKIGGTIISLFIDTSRSQEFKKTENYIDDRELLLFTLAKNSNIAWRLENCPELLKHKSDKERGCNVLLKDEDGYDRTWYEFILDILAGTMTTHNIYNLCFVTMSSKICINTTHIDLLNNYDMLGNDINFIIKKINARDSTFNNYIKKKNYNIDFIIKELSIYMDKCFYNAECIDESIELLETIESKITIESLIEEIFLQIKNKIKTIVKKNKTVISDDDLKASIKCMLIFILNPSKTKTFPIKDTTTVSDQIINFDLKYNTNWKSIWKSQKCFFDSSDAEVISKFKKASVMEELGKLKDYIGSTGKITLLQIMIDATTEILFKRFKPHPKYYYDLKDSSSDYKEVTQTFNAVSLGIEPQEEEFINITEVCNKDITNIFDNNGKITEDCNRRIEEYRRKNCQSSSDNLKLCKKIILNEENLNICKSKPDTTADTTAIIDCRIKMKQNFEKIINSIPPSNIRIGGEKMKINILGRYRKIINKNKKDYIRFKNELITLKEAKILNKKYLNKITRIST